MKPRALCLLLLPLLLLEAAVAALPAPQPVRDFEFRRLNRTYRDLLVAVEPVQSGLLRIGLASPRHEVVLAKHLLRLRPRGDGTHEVALWVQFQGTGRLVADVAALGLGTQLTDDVVLPPQDKLIEARVRIGRSKEGYLVTPVTLPGSTEVQLKSRLGSDILGWCRSMALIPFSPLRCDGLDRALSSAVIPLPPPGETYLLANEELTAGDRTRIEAYLAAETP